MRTDGGRPTSPGNGSPTSSTRTGPPSGFRSRRSYGTPCSRSSSVARSTSCATPSSSPKAWTFLVRNGASWRGQRSHGLCTSRWSGACSGRTERKRRPWSWTWWVPPRFIPSSRPRSWSTATIARGRRMDNTSSWPSRAPAKVGAWIVGRSSAATLGSPGIGSWMGRARAAAPFSVSPLRRASINGCRGKTASASAYAAASRSRTAPPPCFGPRRSGSASRGIGSRSMARCGRATSANMGVCSWSGPEKRNGARCG